MTDVAAAILGASRFSSKATTLLRHALLPLRRRPSYAVFLVEWMVQTDTQPRKHVRVTNLSQGCTMGYLASFRGVYAASGRGAALLIFVIGHNVTSLSK